MQRGKPMKRGWVKMWHSARKRDKKKESMYKNIREKVVIDLRDCARICDGNPARKDDKTSRVKMCHSARKRDKKKESMYKNIREKVVIDLMDCVGIVMGILVRNHWQSDLSPSLGFSDFLLRNWCLIGLVINRRPLIRIF
ncbi:hypothetical protein CEXT_624431 [Caerostris extrusa]|uniref:Uncharacterized protein n=1 Tax=Caerostris extrusa TaxID=172846 RepID=A0AAV4NSB6_CAEEX|nr:hypothetical protein CEXT_624431 [Caerostris extrusa]